MLCESKTYPDRYPSGLQPQAGQVQEKREWLLPNNGWNSAACSYRNRMLACKMMCINDLFQSYQLTIYRWRSYVGMLMKHYCIICDENIPSHMYECIDMRRYKSFSNKMVAYKLSVTIG